MRPRFDIVLTAAVVVSICAGFAPRRAAAEATPYQAAVVPESVDVRAGYSRTFYVVGQLHRGAVVTVVEEMDGWYKIAPPLGVYSIISKAFVDARGDGKTGVVNNDASIVKAAAADPNELSYRGQTQLKKGDTVQIAGEQGSFYKIVPPQGAYVFLPPDSVKPTDAAAAAPSAAATPAPAPVAAAPAPAPAPEPTPPAPEVKPTEPAPKAETTPPAPAPETTPPAPARHEEPAPRAAAETPAPFESSEAAPKAAAPAVEPTPAPAPVSSTPRTAQAQSPALQAAENKLAESAKLPLAKQPLEELLATYRGLSNDANLTLVDQRIIAVRIGQLRRNIEIAAGLKSLDDAKTVASEPIEVPKSEQPTEGVYNPSKYDLVGQLLASGVYNGDTGPRLYRLVEPASMRTLAYVQNGRQWSPRTTLGRIVGIIGETRYDPALKLRIVDVKQMDVLEPMAAGNHASMASPAAANATPSSPTTQPSSAEGSTKDSAKPTTEPAKGEATELMK